MKITFLLAWAYGMGGLVRTTVNTANHFAELGHEVTLLSFFRHRDEPFFEIHPDVKVRPMMDIRESAPKGRIDAWQRRRSSRLIPRIEPYHNRITLRGDYLLWRELRSLDADVLITTRPAFNLAAALWAPKRTVVVGQDHLNFTMHTPALRRVMRKWYPRLDAMVTLTEADRQDYQTLLDGSTTTVRAIGNAVPSGPHPKSRQTEKVVVAAGRYTGQKRFGHLIQAFAKVAEQRPDWRLRIYGDGEGAAGLHSAIAEHGLWNNVVLMGRTTDTPGEFAKGSIMAMSSRYEGYPMVILEAFASGIPVVSYDCPRGPGEMISSGHDGLVVANGDPGALAAGLLTLIDDDELRRKMAENAVDTARRYGIGPVGEQWLELFTQLRAAGRTRPRRPVGEAIVRRLRAALPSLPQRRHRWR
jgi:glycosyltransferase involved in cell wall biosynthesis